MHGFNYREPQIPRSRFNEPGRFGRMFPWLRGLKSFNPGPGDLGAVGGPIDGGNPAPQDTTQNNPRIRAGYTFLGQFRGAALVARTFVALMLKDKASYMVQEPGFVPSLGSDGRFTMTDLVNYTLGATLDSEDLFALPGDDGPGV